MADSEMTLEETNKLRISLGMKPLGEPSASSGEPAELDADQQAELNWKQRKEDEEKDAASKALAAKIAKKKNKQELNAKLKGSTLGDEEPGLASSKDWLKQASKRAKELKEKEKERLKMEKRRKEQEEQDALYGEDDLTGLKVSHDVDAFEEGEEHILTLKDSRILDNDNEDELENVDLAYTEATNKNVDLKRKRKEQEYKGYDDDEFDPANIGKKKNVLGKYDEEDESSGFRLGGAPPKKKEKNAEDEDTSNKVLLDGGLTYLKNLEVSDYLQEGESGFKVKKKKKPKSQSSARARPEADPEEMQVEDEKPVVPQAPVENYVDDDDLQLELARNRRLKAKKIGNGKKLSPEDIAKQLAEQQAEEATALAVERASAAAAVVGNEDDGEGGVIQFDDTSEFVRSINIPVLAEPIVRVIKTETVKEEPEGDIDMNAVLAGPSGTSGDVEMEDGEMDDEDEQLALAALRQGLSIEEMRTKMDAELDEGEVKEEESENGAVPEDGIGSAAEPTLGRGLGGALALLRMTGTAPKTTQEGLDREKVQKEKDLWLADRRRRQAARDLERIKSRGENKDQATREYENRLREQREARESLEAYKTYKPDVEIVYHDEFGRTLTPKEAWKALSHRFHGKGSGKAKEEKRLQRIKEEMKRNAMSHGDTPLSMSKTFQERQERTGEHYMILSTGNKGSISEDAFDKGKGKKKRQDGPRVLG